MLPTEVTDEHANVFVALADGLIHEVTPDVVRPYVDDSFSDDDVERYCREFTKPSDYPGFREALKGVVNNNTSNAVLLFVFITNALLYRALAFPITGSWTLVTEMTLAEREALLAKWRDSPILLMRRLFKLFHSLTITMFVQAAPEIHLKAAGYPGKELREMLYENQEINQFRYPMLLPPKTNGNELYLPNIDVVIVGSGAGAGVTAHTLANAGHKVLVIEKGKYFHSSEFIFDDKDGPEQLYELRGTLASTSQEIFVLAGATFGGGTTVNWLACLKTPFKVRKEWYDEYGIDWAATETYDQCLDYVWRQMGASTDNIKHSFSNQTVLDGAEKLGYKVSEVAQNSGGHPNHSCGLCHLGCKFGVKQGSANCWFLDAAHKGAQFMDQVMVEQILHRHGVALGLLCRDVRTNVSFTIRGPKKYVAAAGSLHTPVLLQKSGFRNKHIGKNLKLHPVTTLFGDFGHDVKTEPYKESIMTSVCTETDDIDGKAHGAKIETILHVPYMEAVFLPWKNSNKSRQDLLKYNNLVALLIITRDKGSGLVTYDAKKPDALVIDYSVSKFDRHALLQTVLTGSDILYIQGAKEIIPLHNWVEPFKSAKPKHERAITDEDYQAWRKTVANYPLDTYGTAYGSAHQMSSCRISGKGPGYGAADLKGRLFECKNVYVADASAMPTASGANPMILTMAIARKISLGIVDDLKPQLRL